MSGLHRIPDRILEYPKKVQRGYYRPKCDELARRDADDFGLQSSKDQRCGVSRLICVHDVANKAMLQGETIMPAGSMEFRAKHESRREDVRL